MTVRTLDYAGQMPKELARTEAIADVKAVDRYTPLRTMAQSLSKRGVAAAKCELINAALLAFVEVLFDADPDGVTPNLDPDGRLLIPAPWGRAGGRLFALRNTEQRALNHTMRLRSEQSAALFVYDVSARTWLVGRGYTGRRPALAYLRQCPISLAEWRASWQATRRPWARQHLGDE
jgi:hypothetical protein